MPHTIRLYMKNNIYIKIISLILILIFTHEQIGWVQEGKPVWADVRGMQNYAGAAHDSGINIPWLLAWD